MMDPLAPLLADGVVDEVVARLKSGKEADLWIVRHGEELVAAKVYKARAERSFRNDVAYREGRRVRNTRTQRAMDRGSRFGQAAAEEAWKAKEADALHALHAAGVRVPKPVMFYEGVLLMELVVDASGHPAPRLIDAHVAREHAAALYADLRAQAVRMLRCDLIHGDLSPYNVLLAWNGPVVIDFPQVVGSRAQQPGRALLPPRRGESPALLPGARPGAPRLGRRRARDSGLPTPGVSSPPTSSRAGGSPTTGASTAAAPLRGPGCHASPARAGPAPRKRHRRPTVIGPRVRTRRRVRGRNQLVRGRRVRAHASDPALRGRRWCG